MGKLFIDTSSLIFGVANKIDCIMQAYKQYNVIPTIPSCVIRELAALSSKKSSVGMSSRYLIEIIKTHKKVFSIELDKYKYADNYFINKATKEDIVATNDTKLIKALRKKGIRTVRLSRKGFFV